MQQGTSRPQSYKYLEHQIHFNINDYMTYPPLINITVIFLLANQFTDIVNDMSA